MLLSSKLLSCKVSYYHIFINVHSVFVGPLVFGGPRQLPYRKPTHHIQLLEATLMLIRCAASPGVMCMGKTGESWAWSWTRSITPCSWPSPAASSASLSAAALTMARARSEWRSSVTGSRNHPSVSLGTQQLVTEAVPSEVSDLSFRGSNLSFSGIKRSRCHFILPLSHTHSHTHTYLHILAKIID